MSYRAQSHTEIFIYHACLTKIPLWAVIDLKYLWQYGTIRNDTLRDMVRTRAKLVFRMSKWLKNHDLQPRYRVIDVGQTTIRPMSQSVGWPIGHLLFFRLLKEFSPPNSDSRKIHFTERNTIQSETSPVAYRIISSSLYLMHVYCLLIVPSNITLPLARSPVYVPSDFGLFWCAGQVDHVVPSLKF